MRPDSIRKFDLFYLGSLAVGIASALLNYDTQLEGITTQLAEAGLQDSAGTMFMVMSAISLGINLLLWFLASRLRMGWVKWILLAFLAFSMLSNLFALTQDNLNVSLTNLVSVLLKAIAVFFLFQQDAKEWFAAAGK
jgi:hypothetical protein